MSGLDNLLGIDVSSCAQVLESQSRIEEIEEDDLGDDDDDSSQPQTLGSGGLHSLNCSLAEFNDLNQIVCLALNTDENFLTTGCPNVDKFLNGGVSGSGLTEFVGPSGTGKTQMALQLTITVQLPEAMGGLDAGAIYISTEGLFPSPRLAQLIQNFKEKYGSNLPDNPMDNILIRHALDTAELLKCVSEIPSVISSRKIGLLVVDSIAATFRSEYENDTSSRVRDLRVIGRALHDIASNYNLVLVCLNQVAASLSSSNSQDFAPSLGVAWRTLVTNRIALSRKHDARWLEVPFSCYIPVRSMQFEIAHDGIFSKNVSYNNYYSVKTNFGKKM